MAWSRESRHARGYGTAWTKLRKRILERDKHLCQSCLRKGRVTAGNIVDHITAKAFGGTDAESNLEVICGRCNKTKIAYESARSQNRTIRAKTRINVEGWPLED